MMRRDVLMEKHGSGRAGRQRMHVVKLGGSLLDLPDLPGRLERYRARLAACGDVKLLVVTGGGEAADIIRKADAMHRLGERASHELAVHAMAFNARWVSRVLKDGELVGDALEAEACWAAGGVAVAEPAAWLDAMQRRGVAMRECWDLTSDSIAAMLAVHHQTQGLSLLKSTDLPGQVRTLAQAAEAGLVDALFPEVAAGLAVVRVVNLRCENLPEWELAVRGGILL